MKLLHNFSLYMQLMVLSIVTALLFMYGVTQVEAQTATVFLTVNNGPSETVAEGESVTLTWWLSNATDCTLTSVGSVSGTGSATVVITSGPETNFTLTCAQGTDFVSVYTLPKITIDPTSTSIMRNSDTVLKPVSFSYSATHANDCGPLYIFYPSGGSSVLAGAASLPSGGTFTIPENEFTTDGDYGLELTCTNVETGASSVYDLVEIVVESTSSIVPPTCPLTAGPDEHLIEFEIKPTKIKSYRPFSQNDAATDPEPITLSPGTYDVRIVAWDGYFNRKNGAQDREEIVLAFGTELAPKSLFDGELLTSAATSDLADDVDSATFNDWVNVTADGTPLVISEEDAALITAVRARHYLSEIYPLPGEAPANSISAVCAKLVPTGASSTPPVGDTAIDVAPHIPSFGLDAMSGWVANRFSGTWDNVGLKDRISNESDIDTSLVTSVIPYRFGVDFDDRLPPQVDRALDGTFSGSIVPLGTSPLQSTKLDGISFGKHFFSITIDPQGSIPNETAANNHYERLIEIPVPRPPMELLAEPNLLQVGDITTLTYSVNVGYPLDCALFGPGMSGTAFTTATAPVLDQTIESTPLQNTTTFALQCTEPITNTTFTEVTTVEVVPEFQEI